MDLKKLLSELSTKEKDELYRKLWINYVKEDIKDLLDSENYQVEDKKTLINHVAYRYVYDGDYDCNNSYWDNLEKLVYEELKKGQ